MLNKLTKNRGGFTLVEIMIVVAIIALLASVAVPSFLRARKRSQATAVKEDLRAIQSAFDQAQIEKNKTGYVYLWSFLWPDLSEYVKSGTRLQQGLNIYYPTDTLGNYIDASVTSKDEVYPVLNSATYTALSDVADASFWAPYTTAY